MRTRSSSNLPIKSTPNPSTSNPKCRNRRHSKQPFIFKESPVDTMADQCTMTELLRAPTEELLRAPTDGRSMGSPSVARKITPASILTWEDLVSKFINEFFPTSRTTNLHNEISNFQQRFDESFYEAWDSYKDLLRACPHHVFSELHQLDTFYNALNLAYQDSLNSAADGNLFERRTQDVLTIIENKSMCLASDGNTFPELRDNIQGYVSAAAINYNQGSGSLSNNTIANPKGELKAITTRSGIVLDGPSVPIPHPFINPEKDERILFTSISLILQGCTSKSSKKKMKSKSTNLEMFKQLHINITLADALILIPKYQKMLKALLSNKDKLLELANTPLNENCSAVILKKLPEKLGDPGKFLIPCGFSELKCKALADLGASINLMSLYVWKKFGLPELISTRMTLELANRAICTPAGIERDVFVLVGKFTFPANFVIVDYKSDPRYHFFFFFNPLLEEFADELALITFPLGNDDLPFDIESDLKEIEYMLHHDPIKDIDSILKDLIDQSNLADLNDNLVDTMLEMFTDEHALDYSSPLIYNEYDDDLFEVESDTKYVYNNPFDSKG
uniref:Retrotransposon gag domain-containing protein n=1 Tax=Tanacetum cinerariifolium TaxID=118510 RepID=A0A6L2PA53_TANCI|nr:hypothetical protein [Tanacetum cinerariifolium]